MKVYAVKVPKKIPAEFDSGVFQGIDERKAEKIRKYKFQDDAIRALFSEILARTVLSKMLRVSTGDISFQYNDYGKAYLLSHYDLNFNVSHSGEWVVAAFDKLSVGIDVEEIKPIDLKIAERFFAKEELRWLHKMEYNKRLRYFYDLWTLKESYIKCIGKGLVIPLDSFVIIKDNNSILLKNSSFQRDFGFKQYNLEKGYIVSVCSESKTFCSDINLLDWRRLVSEFWDYTKLNVYNRTLSHMQAGQPPIITHGLSI